MIARAFDSVESFISPFLRFNTEPHFPRDTDKARICPAKYMYVLHIIRRTSCHAFPTHSTEYVHDTYSSVISITSCPLQPNSPSFEESLELDCGS